MSVQLNDDQRILVEENMGLIGKVIKDRVHNIDRIGIFSYDDLFQIGSVGLCKAAATYNSVNGKFSTYAYVLIRNEIFNALEYATFRKSREELLDVEIMPRRALFVDTEPELTYELKETFASSLRLTNGTTKKGIVALLLMTKGYTCREIGEKMGVPANHVTAWVSKARKYLREDTELKNAIRYCFQ